MKSWAESVCASYVAQEMAVNEGNLAAVNNGGALHRSKAKLKSFRLDGFLSLVERMRLAVMTVTSADER